MTKGFTRRERKPERDSAKKKAKVAVKMSWFDHCGSAYYKITDNSDKTSEAGNEKYCYEFHARSGIRSAIRLQEDY
jgi:hypothetical protein